MNLVSMKNTEDDAPQPCPQEAYPYGLRLCLNDEQCEALGIKGPISAGSTLMVTAKVVVVRCTESLELDDGDEEPGDTGNEIALDLQITDMALSAPTKEVDLSVLYNPPGAPA